MSKLIGNEFVEIIEQIQKGISDSWREYAKAKHSNDVKALERASLQIATLSQASMAALKVEGLKYEAELKPGPGENEEEKITRLLTAFARGTRLTRVWSDTMHQQRIGFCCAKKIINQVLPELDAMNRRGDIVIFLDDPDLSIRAKAAARLLDEMPDRCLPILREIDRTERALNAGWIACWALDAYERRTGVKST